MWFTDPHSMETHGHAKGKQPTDCNERGYTPHARWADRNPNPSWCAMIQKIPKTGNCNQNNNVVTKMRAQRPESI